MDFTDVSGDPAGYLSADALRAVGEAAGLTEAQLRHWLADPVECRQALTDAEEHLRVAVLDEALEKAAADVASFALSATYIDSSGEIFTPHQWIERALNFACDNIHDIGADRELQEAHAISAISCDIMRPADVTFDALTVPPLAFPDSGYLDSEEGRCPFTCGQLARVLASAVRAFLER
jgi:hypothetical protein